MPNLNVDDAVRAAWTTLDLVGTFVFALSGGTAAAKRRLDFFGVMVVALAAGVSGGITRDILIGAVPPNAVSDVRYVAASLAAGLLAFFWHTSVQRMQRAVLVFDAMGLALFAVSGANKALAFGLNPAMAAMLGMLTGIGGGIARDLLVGEVPAVLRSEVYAVAALAGASIAVAGHMLALPSTASALVAVAIAFGVRMLAILRGWNLPPARHSAAGA